jgi:cysteinyl-tRNA synthetase
MAEEALGADFDVHGGGIDLLFPHHENEVAQSTCAHGGKVFARFWVHNGMLNFGGAKMSKSLGNVSILHELLASQPAESLRYALLSAHYRQPLDWSEALIEQSTRTLDRLYGTLRDLADVDAKADAELPEAVEAALCDDLNTPAVLAELARLAAEARKAEAPADKRRIKGQILAIGGIMGLLQQDPQAWFGQGGDDDARIQALVEERSAAKKARDFARSDAIRDQLAAEGVLLEDTAAGVRWTRRRA